MAEQVEAHIIETDVSPLSGADRWLAETSERVAEMCERHRRPTRIENDQQYKDAKDERADINTDYRELDAERKAMTRSIEDGIKRFRKQVKDVLSPLDSLQLEYKAEIERYEGEWRANRQIELAREYADIAPMLAEIVPFDRILARYGSERGTGWMLRGTGIEEAKDALAVAVAKVAKAEASIDAMVAEEDREDAKATLFDTLDLDAAMDLARSRAERREQVRRLAAERAAIEAERQRMEAEAEATRRAEEAMMAEQPQPWGARTAPSVVPAPEPDPALAPSFPVPDELPADYLPAEAAEAAPQDAPRPWVVVVPSATRAQMEALARALSGMGIAGQIKSGTVYDVCGREA